jgi:LGFP repeat
MSGVSFLIWALERVRHLMHRHSKPRRVGGTNEGLRRLLTELTAARYALEQKSADLHGVTGLARSSLQQGDVGNVTRVFPFAAKVHHQAAQSSVGFHRQYEYGTIFWRRDLGAHRVHGTILQKYISLHCDAGVLGYPQTDEMQVADGLGRLTEFERGAVCDHLWISGGPFVVHGAIFEKWKMLGQVAWGFPFTDECKTSNGMGCYNHFRKFGLNDQNEDLSIYWTPFTGPRAVGGTIRKRWATLGWDRSYLGYPVSDELDFFDSHTGRKGRISYFQHGYILCWSDDHRVAEDCADINLPEINRLCPGTTTPLRYDLAKLCQIGLELRRHRQAANVRSIIPP